MQRGNSLKYGICFRHEKKQNHIFDKYYKVVGNISNFLILFVLYIKKSPSRFYRDANMLEIKMESVTSYIQVQVLQTGI